MNLCVEDDDRMVHVIYELEYQHEHIIRPEGTSSFHHE